MFSQAVGSDPSNPHRLTRDCNNTRRAVQLDEAASLGQRLKADRQSERTHPVVAVVVPFESPTREGPNRIASFEGDVIAIDGVELQLHAIETVLDARSRHAYAGSGRGRPLQGQVHRDPIDIDGYVLFGSQPLSWGAVLAYVLSLDKDHPTGDLLTCRVRLTANEPRRHAAASDTPLRFRHVRETLRQIS